MTAAYSYSNTLLLIEQVYLKFGDKTVLGGVDAEIRNIERPGLHQGQVVAILGPSGVGKTQLLHIIAGLKKPTDGQVLIPNDDGDPSHFQEVERGKVGVVFQNYPLFEHRTVYSNLMVAATGRRVKPTVRKEYVEEILERFDLADHWQKYPAQLSGGQRQRVAIAQQILCSEHFLLMDEPFSGLDIVAEAKVCQTICELAGADDLNTIILVTHDVTAAATVADHIWMLGRQKDHQGASIVETYDLIERDLCWHPEITQDKVFLEFVREVKDRFLRL